MWKQVEMTISKIFAPLGAKAFILVQRSLAVLLLHSLEIKDILGHPVWESKLCFFGLIQKETDNKIKDKKIE